MGRLWGVSDSNPVVSHHRPRMMSQLSCVCGVCLLIFDSASHTQDRVGVGGEETVTGEICSETPRHPHLT